MEISETRFKQAVEFSNALEALKKVAQQKDIELVVISVINFHYLLVSPDFILDDKTYNLELKDLTIPQKTSKIKSIISLIENI